MPASEPIDVQVTINGREISREQVLAWESRRADAVLAKYRARLGARGVSEILPEATLVQLRGGALPQRRSALATLRTELGHAGIYGMLKRELAISERITRIGVAMSRGRVKYAATHVRAPGLSAERFAEWFDNLVAINDENAMDAACPDHYLLRGLPDGRQEVVETTGGSPAASRFLVDYQRTEDIAIAPDPAYPVQVAGTALLDDGLAIGGVRHQFRDNDGTLEALLTVQFPASVPSRNIHQHQWHLACEFSNWMIASAPYASITL
ncbi:hypothetical protein NN3_19740 [Nocardia neocaledoniensis NBRC 108232]|uniref:Uncharacterized protein n=1 Tax=Nocardia neocaledoniensis TaxID=236511 RepID=A0A317NI32_9NOCA|nr:hypothetical protein [Nocardia neocaledoniensis]PWV74971.1 hypothetical protein DFR69_10537 [Nocardia neocaledoniensis]GEM30967.1 hypothetical protein NN3_19740 [Nocardia neocaledoniensis NBRC 108232]